MKGIIKKVEDCKKGFFVGSYPTRPKVNNIADGGIGHTTKESKSERNNTTIILL